MNLSINRRSSCRRRWLYASSLVFALSVAALAQTYQGRIMGTVTDQRGAVVKDAKVVVTNIETGASRTLDTTDTGDYVAPNLPPGLYNVTAEATGFKRVERREIRLEVAKDVRIDIEMTPGDISESVMVSTEAPLIETTNDTLGGTFSNKAINDLPLNGRDFQNLVVLRPGVQRSPGGGFLSISSNGNRPEDNNFIVDGTDNNDPYYGTTVINAEGVQGTPGTILPIDAIQEFNALENPPAEYGWKPGAIINLGLKSGTNDLHGTAYYFGRNDNLDARNFFNPDFIDGVPNPRKELRQHQFGASAGGPIIRNKLFIFGAYEGVRALVSNSNQVASPATVSLGGDPENSIPDAIAHLASFGIPVNPLSANLLGIGEFSGNGPFPGLFPVNNTGSILLNTGFPNTNRMDNFIIKMDYHYNDKNTFSGRYFFGDSLQTEQDIAVLRPEWLSQSQLRAQVLGFNWTWTPSGRWANEARFGYNRFWQSILTVDHAADPVTVYGINTGVTDPINFGMPRIDIGGFNQLGGNRGWPLLTTPNQTYQFSDNISYIAGKHTIRFGGEFRHGVTDNLRNRSGKSRVRFFGGQICLVPDPDDPEGCLEESTALEDFIAGFPSRGDIFVGDSHRIVSMNSFGAYIQDDWRISPRLTLNLGLRYDFNSVIKEKNDQLGNFDPEVGLQQVGINIDKPYDADYNNFAPRIGLAWDPWGKGRTVIRLGGGLTYEIPHLAVFLGQNGINSGAVTPGINTIPTGAFGVNINGTIGAAPTSVSGGNINWTAAGPLFNTALDCSPDTGSPCDILGVDRHLRTPYVFNWNINVQQQLTDTLALQVAYVGSKGTKLYSVRDVNQVDPNSPEEIACDHCEQAGRPFNSRFPFLGYIYMLENGYNSWYNGLQVTLTQRYWKGLNFIAGYTWAHAIDYVSLNRAAQPQNSFNARAERGNSDLDIRHRFTLSMSYDLPSKKSWGQLLEGWQINSIVTLQTGAPFTAYDFENDVSLTGEFSDRWNINGDPSRLHWSQSEPVPCTDATGAPAFDENGLCTAYANGLLTIPEFGTFGNAGRNIFRGPGFRNWDLSLVKTWKFSERADVQFRAEFFNVLNHPNFANPAILFNNDLGIPDTFGLSTATPDVAGANPVIGTGGPRNIQFGLKFRY